MDMMNKRKVLHALDITRHRIRGIRESYSLKGLPSTIISPPVGWLESEYRVDIQQSSKSIANVKAVFDPEEVLQSIGVTHG